MCLCASESTGEEPVVINASEHAAAASPPGMVIAFVTRARTLNIGVNLSNA